jgi:NADH dehydrogenase
VDVTRVNRENFFLFTPLLHEVAASDLDVTHIVNPIRKLLRRVHCFEGDIEATDLSTQRVVVSHGFDHHPHELVYDHLVLALGAVTNFYNLPGLEAHALTMRSLGDAMALRNRLIAQLEEADSEGCAHSLQPSLTVVVAGGGFAGVETIAAVNDFVREALACYPHLGAEHLRLVLVHSGPVILPELGDKLGAYAQRKLAARQVDIRVNTKVAGVSEGCVHLSDGTVIQADTLVWTVGTSPHPLVEQLPCTKQGGRVLVNADLAVPEWPGVWALGDCAQIPDRQTGTACPPTAQHALRAGKVVARNIAAVIRLPATGKQAWTTYVFDGKPRDSVAFVVRSDMAAWQEVWAVAANPGGTLRRLSLGGPALFGHTWEEAPEVSQDFLTNAVDRGTFTQWVAQRAKAVDDMSVVVYLQSADNSSCAQTR